VHIDANMMGVALANGSRFRRGMPPTDLKTPSDQAKAIGRAIKQMRHRAGLTQLEAAEALNVSRIAWQNYENGRPTVLRIDLQDRIAKALDGSRQEMLAFAGLGPEGHAPQDGEEDGGAFGRAQAVFPLREGEVVLSFPEEMSADAVEELNRYLELFISSRRRAVS
jgi:transcriptional regulator with XRE-family HTH domain